jgi:hypothetical protein
VFCLHPMNSKWVASKTLIQKTIQKKLSYENVIHC